MQKKILSLYCSHHLRTQKENGIRINILFEIRDMIYLNPVNKSMFSNHHNPRVFSFGSQKTLLNCVKCSTDLECAWTTILIFPKP